MKKTILILLLIPISCLCQIPERHNDIYEYGITIKKWIRADYGILCNIHTDAISDYVDIRVKVVHERVLGPCAHIFTNKGKCKVAVEPELNKNGYSIIRLFYRNKDLWVGIDSGIARIEFKTDKTWRIININDNLSKLKNYNDGKILTK